MKILFEDLRITTEKKSYQTTQNNLEISLGMETENLNLAENSVEIEWKLRKFNDSIFSEGRKNIKIGSFETKLFLNNLLLNSIYVLEIYNPNSVEKTVIYTGNKNNLIIVDENYIFQGNNPKIFGDAVLTNEKKLKLTEDWDVLRRYGNAIISSEQNFFVFAPKIIFTSRKEVPEIIDFFPFDGLLSSKIKLYIIPEITQISPYVFQIQLLVIRPRATIRRNSL